jgi:glycosyltransferase involved in cell wall biosynthesis
VVTRLNIGGPSIHVSLLSTALDPRRFSTCLVVGEADAAEGDLSGLVDGGRIRFVRLKTLRRAIRPWEDLVSWLALLRIVWQERPRLLHTHMAKAGALGRLAGLCYNRLGPGRAAGARILLVHTFHGHVLEGYFHPWISWIFVAIERWLARRTDRLIAVSQAVRDALLQKGIGRPDQWCVIPLGLNLSALAQLPPPNGSSTARFGMVGRLVPIKNPTLFLQALDRLRRRHPTLSVAAALVGDGPLRQALAHTATRLGLGDHVRFTGWQQDLRAVYEGLDAVCLTSWNEGTPVALIEAMAAGRPVIATAVGGVPDLLGVEASAVDAIRPGTYLQAEGGWLIRSGDLEGLVAALATCAEDPELRRVLGQAGRSSVVERFAHTRLLQDVEELYEQLQTAGGDR